jgi:alkanesulfonate monooxygenase SsuD/methylene tetrahydromethanopterin reductase-like flavin-dependent oxidoreductase (luciferase family)
LARRAAASSGREVAMRFGISFFVNNYGDWDRFEALERGEEVGPPAISDEQLMREHYHLGSLVEPLGFDTLWAFEQHAAPYILIPDPHQYLTYFAARTSRIDFGSMIVVLPWHNPVRVAEQVAVLQHQMGRGRHYYLGVGRGLAFRNFNAMGVRMEDARELFNEALDIVELALAQELFSYEGAHFRYDNVAVRPRPFDRDAITILGSWTSEQSLRNMASRGLQPLTNPSKEIESYLGEMRLFNEVRAEAGFGPANQPVLQVMLACCQSEQEAQEAAAGYFRELVDSILRMYQIEQWGERMANTKGYEQYTSQGSDFGSGSYESAVDTLTAKFVDEGIVGTPEQCLEKVIAHYETIAPSEMVVVNSTGGMPAAFAEKSMRLFAEKVMPRAADHIRAVAGARPIAS